MARETFYGLLDDEEGSPSATLRGDVPSTDGAGLPHITLRDAEDVERDTDDFVILGTLGEGGMGIVRLARQPLLDREVALKQARSSASAASVLREARITGSLEHPNIIPVHLLGASDEGLPILVMKKVEGTSWRTLIREPDHPAWAHHVGQEQGIERHVELLISVCNAVRFAHSRGVIHRDLKPENVMRGEHGEVYVLDWGIAARVGDPVPNQVVGTPAYMSPEQATGAAPEVQADVYLLGACLYEALAGVPPHHGISVEEALEHARSGALERPVGPDELVDVCLRALSTEPTDRFADVGALQRALSDVLRHQGAVRLTESAVERMREVVELDPAQQSVELAAVRFGLDEALEVWPENEAARDALLEVLERLIDLSIEREQVDAAAGWLAELDARGGDTAAFQVRLEAVRGRVDRRRGLASDMDLTRGSSARFWMMMAAVAAAAVIGIYNGAVVPTWGELAVYLGLMTLGVIGVHAWMREQVAATRIGRAVMIHVYATVGMMVVLRLLSWKAGYDVPIRMGHDLAMLAGSAVIATGYVVRWAWALAVAPLLGAALIVFVNPDWAGILFQVCTMTSVGLGIVLWRVLGADP